MWKYSFFSIIIISLLSACATPEQIMLSKVKKSGWYSSQLAQVKQNNSKRIKLRTAYVFAGQIKEVRYNYYKKTISDIVLAPSHCLYAPSYWDEWFDPYLVNFDTNNDDFKNGNFPTVGEHWAFRVSKGPKGRYKIESTVKLFRDTDSSSKEK